MDSLSIRGEVLPDDAKNTTWKILHAYIYAHSQRLIDEYPGDGVQAITRFQSQCENMNFAKQIRYKVFQKVIHKGGESSIYFIKIFHNAKALATSVVNSYSKDQLMYTFSENFQNGVEYASQISSHQSEFRREEDLLIKNYYPCLP